MSTVTSAKMMRARNARGTSNASVFTGSKDAVSAWDAGFATPCGSRSKSGLLLVFDFVLVARRRSLPPPSPPRPRPARPRTRPSPRRERRSTAGHSRSRAALAQRTRPANLATVICSGSVTRLPCMIAGFTISQGTLLAAARTPPGFPPCVHAAAAPQHAPGLPVKRMCSSLTETLGGLLRPRASKNCWTAARPSGARGPHWIDPAVVTIPVGDRAASNSGAACRGAILRLLRDLARRLRSGQHSPRGTARSARLPAPSA